MQLISTNVFGQNTSAIAAAEAQYGEILFGHRGVACLRGQFGGASAVTPFSTPPQIANPAAQGTQATRPVATTAGTRPVDADGDDHRAAQRAAKPLHLCCSRLTVAVVAVADLFGAIPHLNFGTADDLQPTRASSITPGLPYFSIGMGA